MAALALLLPALTASAGGHKFDGVWASEGYGRLMQVDGGKMKIFQVTGISCTLIEQEPLDGFLHYINRIDMTEKDHISFYDEGGITRYDYSKLKGLPKNCTDAVNSDPEHNFDVFWHAFNDNYAFFDLHDVDWDEIYRTYRSMVNKDTTEEQLFAVMVKMIKVLNDGHVTLRGMGKRESSGHPGTLKKLLRKSLSKQKVKVRPAAKKIIAEHYLGDTKHEAINGNQFTWGWAAHGIGYLSIDSMASYLADDDASLWDSLRLVDKVMAQVLTDLDGAKSFIVDARWNGGGYDANALVIASYFTDQHLLAFTKRARNGEGYNPAQEIFIPHYASKTFAGPVVYLCDKDTFSAAEIFSMAMQAMPNVTSMGEQTGGALSDMLSFMLPNGWELTMSNEVYIASDGKLYEGLGIPVDVELTVGKNMDFEGYIKLGMDRAISFLQK